MKFDQARLQVTNYLLENNGVIDADELHAVATHFLHNLGSLPPMIQKAIGQKLLKTLFPNISLKKRKTKKVVAESAEPYQLKLDLDFGEIPYPPLEKPDFTFIDLFAGIGGFRIAFQAAGGKCVFTSEWDKFAKQTYEANFGEVPYCCFAL